MNSVGDAFSGLFEVPPFDVIIGSSRLSFLTKEKRYMKNPAVPFLLLVKKKGHVDLSELMRKLGEMKIDSVLLEGGGELNWSALEAGIVDKVQAYIAPKIFGGAAAKTPVSGRGADDPESAFMLETVSVRTIGEDILIESRVKNVHGNN